MFETVTAGVTIQSPQLDISEFLQLSGALDLHTLILGADTVAAGGGSKLFWRNSMFVVGPDSAGAHPGPGENLFLLHSLFRLANLSPLLSACYRKGGPLTVTDANLFLGRLHTDSFPKIFGPSENEPLDYEVTARLFAELTTKINADTGGSLTPKEVACGFINVANETMARPIRGEFLSSSKRNRAGTDLSSRCSPHRESRLLDVSAQPLVLWWSWRTARLRHCFYSRHP